MIKVNEFVDGLMWFFKVVILAGLVALAWYATDRKPPFAIIESPQVFVTAGSWLRVTADVKRDQSRRCDAEYTRYLFDANATRYDLGHAVASAQMIANMERQTPGKLNIAVLIPPSAASGPARVVTVLEYRCNKVHNFWPISVTTEIPFEIVP